MLGNITAIATLPVRDIDAARRFYEDTLGLEPVDTGEAEVLSYRAGDSSILVYRSEYAGTNQATAATWPLGDRLESVVRALKGKGIAFEHYDLPGTTRTGEIHGAGQTRVAWFKDPDGNIHALVSG